MASQGSVHTPLRLHSDLDGKAWVLLARVGPMASAPNPNMTCKVLGTSDLEV